MSEQVSACPKSGSERRSIGYITSNRSWSRS
jgi:hypothetical protein